jgi:putative DNA primase/helicase
MTNQEKVPEQVGDDSDDDTHNPLSRKAKDKEKYFQKVLAIVRSPFMLSRNKSGTVYATVLASNVFETMPLTSPRIHTKIKKIIRDKCGIRAPKQMIAELVEELQDQADDAPLEVYEVHHRVALGTKGQIFVDLHNQGNVVLEVDKNGYRHHDFATEAPLFIRPAGMTALPDPVGAASNLDLLRGFLNYGTEGNWILLVVFILYSLRPLGPYVILVVLGTAGSSKSTFSRLLRLLIDPSSVPTQALPRTISDLMITASNSHLLVFDNVRTLSVEMSDALCQLATGGGSRTRTLYTNSEETLVHVTKPCILNGIDDVASQPDLVSRCLLMELPTITVRRTEEDLNNQFAASLDAIFAGLMDTLSKTLAELDNVTDLPENRMADFSRFGMAVERALNWPKDSFKEAYAHNQQQQMANSLGDDPLAAAMRTLVKTEVTPGMACIKTPTDLLAVLREVATHSQVTNKAWPMSPHSLSKRLKKMEPALRACGIGVTFQHSGNRTISVKCLENFKKQH